MLALSFCSAITAISSCNKATKTNTNDSSQVTTRTPPQANYNEIGLDVTQVTADLSTDQNIASILNSSLVVNALATEGWSIDPDNLFTKMTNIISGRYGYVLDLVSNDENIGSSIVIVPIDESKGIYDVILAKAITSEDGAKSTFARSITDNYPYTNLDPEYMTSDEKLKLFRAQFRACMASAWNDITNSASGIIACSLAPGPCVLACVIACSSGMAIPPDCAATTPEEAIDCLCAKDMIDCNDVVKEDEITFVPIF